MDYSTFKSANGFEPLPFEMGGEAARKAEDGFVKVGGTLQIGDDDIDVINHNSNFFGQDEQDETGWVLSELKPKEEDN